jgi:hypothetical protein
MQIFFSGGTGGPREKQKWGKQRAEIKSGSFNRRWPRMNADEASKRRGMIDHRGTEERQVGLNRNQKKLSEQAKHKRGMLENAEMKTPSF